MASGPGGFFSGRLREKKSSPHLPCCDLTNDISLSMFKAHLCSIHLFWLNSILKCGKKLYWLTKPSVHPLNPHVGWFKWVCLKGYNLQFQRRIPSRFPISGGFPIPTDLQPIQDENSLNFRKPTLKTDLKPMVLDMFWPSTAVRDLGSWRGFTLSRLGWKPNLQGISFGCWYGIAAIASSLLHSVSISKISKMSKISSWFYSCVWITIAYLGLLDTL